MKRNVAATARGTFAACLLVLASACGPGDRTPTAPAVVQSPAPPSSTSPSPSLPPQVVPGQINVGVELTDTLTGHGSEKLYELTAPKEGTLILRLSWTPHQGLLALKLADTQFTSSPPDWSPPIVAKVRVAAGRTYSVRISDGAPWDYDDLRLPFVVTTSME